MLPLYSGAIALFGFVDCMNHSAMSSLNWRTPIEVLDGLWPDISVLCFAVCQPVCYHEPAVKYPDPNF
jgi:hypothetical protein